MPSPKMDGFWHAAEAQNPQHVPGDAQHPTCLPAQTDCYPCLACVPELENHHSPHGIEIKAAQRCRLLTIFNSRSGVRLCANL